MVEKVNPAHPDKIADRIAGAVVDYCHTLEKNPNVCVDVTSWGKKYNVMLYSSVGIDDDMVKEIVGKLAGNDTEINLIYTHINPYKELECDDSGVFIANPMTGEEMEVSNLSRRIFEMVPFNGKCVLDESSGELVVDQSRMKTKPLEEWLKYKYPHMKIITNPLGEWGGDNICGSSNSMLFSDFGHSLINKCIHGKDCGKVDVSISIYAWLLAQSTGKPQKFKCTIGDKEVNGIPYKDIVDTVKEYIGLIGGYESLGAWGLI